MAVLLKDLSGDGVLTLTLNRPEKHNALNNELMRAVEDAVVAAKNDPAVKVILIRGEGKPFCSGADLGNLDEIRKNVIVLQEHLSHYGNMLLKLVDAGKPTIAAVTGYALAGGCGLAATADITFAAESAQFGIPEVTRGIWGMMITAPISRLVGTKKSLELMYTDERFSAAEAERIGLINRVVPDDQLMQAASDFAHTLAARSPLAVRFGRDAMYKTRDMEFYKSMDYLNNAVVLLNASEDAAEGFRAFKEKREPVWQGK